MARIVRKFHVFALFIIGIFFWAVLKNGLSSDSSSLDQEGATNYINSHHHQDKIIMHLSNLEGEVAAQKVYSNLLLDKIRLKYRKKDRTGSSSSKGNNAKDKIVNNNNSNLNSLLSKEEIRRKENDGKLAALQKELQQEAHAGEVKSDIFDPNYVEGDKGNKDKAPKNGQVEEVNGEVIDEHVPLLQEDKETSRVDQFSKNDVSVIAVLVFVCDRPTIKRSLDLLFKYRPSASKFPVIVSQDCGAHPATTSVIKSYDKQITHIMQPDLSDIDVPPKESKMKGYYKIARHYGWALNYTFNTLNYDNVIIVEDDLDIAPDFFEYFAATLPILKKDASIWCVSAWNDNGKPNRINETAYDLLHRTDFFPGLGWMMTKDLWRELMVKWPRGYWDDWMREPAQRRDRVCIRPEISRSKTFGKEGVSHGTYYNNHLKFIKLNEHFVPFTSLNLSYLLKDDFDVEFVRRVYSSQLVYSVSELLQATVNPPQDDKHVEYRLIYRNQVEFRNFAKKLDIMDDFKAGVPRTAYRGVVSFILKGYRCYLAPGANWVSYKPS